MNAWILEADIYRLEKAFFAADRTDERERLRLLLAAKRRQLDVERRRQRVAMLDRQAPTLIDIPN